MTFKEKMITEYKNAYYKMLVLDNDNYGEEFGKHNEEIKRLYFLIGTIEKCCSAKDKKTLETIRSEVIEKRYKERVG